ncbi:hypothetical protein Tco_0494205, partial [Tanacetum coccineum]
APSAWYDMLPKFYYLKSSIKLKYALEIIKKYGMKSSDSVDTPMVDITKLDEDLPGIPVDPTRYRCMIGSLMYLTSSRPDLVFAACMCARYQAKPTEKHLHAVKHVFRYLKGTINMGLWYSKDTGIALTAYADADDAGCQDTRRSTSGNQVENGVVELYFVKTKYQLADIFTKALVREIFEFLISRIGMKSMSPEQVENGMVDLYFVKTKYQLADIFTKALVREIFEFLISRLGMKSMSPETLKSLAEEEEE